MKNNSKKHTLQEKEGMLSPETVSPVSAEKLKLRRKNRPGVKTLVEGIVNGDNIALSRAITLIESSRKHDMEAARAIIEQCLLPGRKFCSNWYYRCARSGEKYVY